MIRLTSVTIIEGRARCRDPWKVTLFVNQIDQRYVYDEFSSESDNDESDEFSPISPAKKAMSQRQSRLSKFAKLKAEKRHNKLSSSKIVI